MSDGAAAVLMMRRGFAEQLGMNIIGVVRSYAVVGVPPDVMGIGTHVLIHCAGGTA